ncbi:MAG: creatininase family protein [Anaerolineales bacterium]|nr:creatininase family protein [Anaerolineales bacterium]
MHTSHYQTKPILLPDSERDKVILIPIGHTEQHGYHLPLSVDTIIISAIAKGTTLYKSNQSDMTTRSFTLPVMPYGVSTHRASFAGTMNAGGRAFEDFWLAVIDTLVTRGFNRFYLMSGHGGNTSFLVNVVKYAGERHRRIFVRQLGCTPLAESAPKH